MSMMGMIMREGYTNIGPRILRRIQGRRTSIAGSAMRSTPGGTTAARSRWSGMPRRLTSSPPRHGSSSTSGVKWTRTAATSCTSLSRTGTRTPKTYAASTKSAPDAHCSSSSRTTSSELLPSTFTPPMVGGVGPSVSFSKPIQCTMFLGTRSRRMGSTLSRTTSQTDVSTCGQSASSTRLRNAARFQSGSRAHRGMCLSAVSMTSGGSGFGISLRRDLTASAASLRADSRSDLATARRQCLTITVPTKSPTHQPKIATLAAALKSFRKPNSPRRTVATTDHTAPNALVTMPSALMAETRAMGYATAAIETALNRARYGFVLSWKRCQNSRQSTTEWPARSCSLSLEVRPSRSSRG